MDSRNKNTIIDEEIIQSKFFTIKKLDLFGNKSSSTKNILSE